MKTEYLDKCWHLLNWQESADEVVLWKEMGELRYDLVQLSVLFSNELILNILEASSREQMLRVIETYLLRISVGTKAPLEFVSSVESFSAEDYKPKGSSEYIDASGHEQYMLDCYHLMDFLTTEIQLISRVYGFELESIIEKLSQRLVKIQLNSIEFMQDYCLGYFSDAQSAEKPEKIKWLGNGDQLSNLIIGLMESKLINESNVAEFQDEHFGSGKVSESFYRVEWHHSKALLSHLVEVLVKKRLIEPRNPYAEFQKHFLRNGRPVEKLSLTSSQADGVIRDKELIDNILVKL